MVFFLRVGVANDGPGTEGNAWPTVPRGLDRLSFDLYDSRKGRHFEVTEVQAAFEIIRPKLKPHQRMVLVPGEDLARSCHFVE